MKFLLSTKSLIVESSSDTDTKKGVSLNDDP